MTERADLAEKTNDSCRRKEQQVPTRRREIPRGVVPSSDGVAHSVLRSMSLAGVATFSPSIDHDTSRVQRSSTAVAPGSAPSSAAPSRVQRAATATDSEHAKQMSSEGGNPKSDPPRGRGGEVLEEYEEDDDGEIDAVADQAISQVKSKTMNVAIGEYRAGQDRVHRKKKAQVAKRSRDLDKLKGRVAIAASDVATGVERAGNRGKHGLLNAGRSVGRLLGMKAKPNTAVKKETGANTTDTASGAYGAVDTEYIEPKFTVKLEGDTWHPILTHLKGYYGKITAPLPGGLSEITGPDPADSKQQIKDLLALDGADWYMVKAVDAHESIHEDHVHDALNNVGNVIAQLFATLTVDLASNPTAKDAIAAIKLLPGCDAIMNLADPNNSQIRQVWDNEYVNQITGDHDGPTQNAEADVVEPMIGKINSWRKKKKLKKIKKKWTCLNDSNAVQIPKGRKNP